MNEMLKRCEAIAPHLTAIDPNTVADLLEAIDRTAETFTPRYIGEVDTIARGTDAAENWQSILAASEATAASSGATSHDIGEVNAVRAAHLRITDRAFYSEATNSEQRLEDSFTAATRSVVVKRRSKRGNYSEVKRYGQTLLTAGNVAVDFEPAATVQSILAALAIVQAIAECKRGGDLMDGIGLARIASRAYDVPVLLGGEQKNYSEVLPADVSAGLTGYSYSRWTTGPYSGNTRHEYRRVKYGTRVALAALRARSGEVLAPRTVEGVTLLTAPHSDRDRMFVGHRVHNRVASARSGRTARTYSETFTLRGDPLLALHDIAAVLHRDAVAALKVARLTDKRAKLDRTAAVRWHVVDGMRGTLTVSRTGRLSFTVNGAPHLAVRGARTVGALVKGASTAFID